ncbi:hypothetical protein D3C75_1306520 [compost metagenome]
MMLKGTMGGNQGNSRLVLKHFKSDLGMLLHLIELIIRKFIRLQQDGRRNLRLANIVQQCAHSKHREGVIVVAMNFTQQ